jgi:hypothetical protein
MKKLLLVLVLVPVFCNVSLAQSFIGCASNSNSGAGTMFRLLPTTGNLGLDNFISDEVWDLRQFFQVEPSFFMYNDAGSPNARAFAMPEVPIYPDGTVILGIEYMLKMYRFSGSHTVLPVTVAHEFGHIVDFKYNVVNAPGMKAELFADFMAGTFLFHRSSLKITDVISNLRWFVNIGDFAAINDPSHHGTPDQRLDAAMAGYKWLRNRIMQVGPGVYIGVDEAIDAGKVYLNIP